jgi:hypothetical protein
MILFESGNLKVKSGSKDAKIKTHKESKDFSLLDSKL